MKHALHWRIRVLVALDACCFLAIWRVGAWEMARLQEPWNDLAWVAWDAWWGQRETLALTLLTITGIWAVIGWIWLCCDVRSGRWVYLGALLWYTGTLLVMPPSLATPITGTLTAVNWLLVGIMLTLCFLPDNNQRQEPGP